MRQRTLLSMLCGVATLSAIVGAQVIQTRDQAGPPRAAGNAPVPGGNGAIAGVILSDEANPQPLRRVTVTVSGDGFGRSTLTDDRGRFQIDGLPAARLNLAATKPGYVRAAYGARRPDRPGTAITLADAQRVMDITLKLARGSVITGTILDELGMPAVGVGVRAMQYRLQPGGERALVPATSAQMLNEITDDRGSYRLYGLAAGEYVIVAAPRMPEGGEVRAMSDAEIRAAMAQVQQPPGMAGGRGGAGGYAGAPNATPQAASDAVTIGYSPVFYPGTTLAARAGSITVGVGEERTSVDFALSIVRTARIEGSVVMPQGVSPQNVSLLMVSSNAMAMAGGDLINSTRVGADGKFTYTNVAPGQYTITARTGGRSNVMTFGPGGGTAVASFVMATPGGGRGNGGTGANANAPMPADPTPQLWGMTDVSVDGQNLSNVSISLQPGMTLSGRLAFEGVKMTAPTDLSRARVILTPVATGSGISMSLGSAEIDAAGKFTIAGLTPGKYRFTATVPSDGALGSWTLKSATAGGRDALDVPLDLAPNEVLSNAVVTFTDATQEVSGRLQDASGRPAPDFTMVVFPADTRFWLPQARRIKTARPSTDGRFVVPGLPPGDYRIAAVLDIAPNEANDPAFLQQLLPAAVPFTLAAGEKHVQDFKIGGF